MTPEDMRNVLKRARESLAQASSANRSAAELMQREIREDFAEAAERRVGRRLASSARMRDSA